MKTKRRRYLSSAAYWIFVAGLGGGLFALYANAPHFDSLPSMRVVSADATDHDSVPSMHIVEPGIELRRPSSLVPPGKPDPQRRNRREIEQDVRGRLTREGFPNVGVSVARDRSVFLAGSIFDPSESGAISDLVRQTPGVKSVHFTDVQLLKPSGGAYLGTETGTTADGHGAAVLKVFRGTPAAVAGIKTGDVITSFGGKPVKDSDRFHEIVKSYHGGQRVPVVVMRGKDQLTMTVRLGKAAGALASK